MRQNSTGWLIGWTAAGLSGVVFLTCLAGARQKPANGPAARLSEAPPSARSLRNPFAGKKQAAAAGRKLFKQHCAECHGANGYGTGHAANLHVPDVQGTSDGSLFWVLRNGRIRRGMPSWSQLPDQRLWEIVTYLRTFKIK